MPQLPDRQRSGFLQTEVPRQTAPIMDVGSQFDAMAKLGGTIGNIAMDLQEKRTRAEEQQFLTNKDTEDLLATKEFMKKQRVHAPPDGSGYTEAVTKFTKDRLAKNIEEAPTENAKLRYQQSAGNFFTRSIIDASSYETERKITKMDMDMTNNVQAFANNQIDNPDQVEAAKKMAGFDLDYDGYVQAEVYDQLTANKKKEEARNITTKGMLDGMYSRGGRSLNDALKLITTEKGGEESIFSNALTPTEKKQYKERFLNKIQSDREISTAKVIKRANDTATRALLKRDVTASEINATESNINRIKDPLQRAETLDNFRSSVVIQTALKNADGMDNNMLRASLGDIEGKLRGATADSIKDKNYNFKDKARLENLYKESVKDIIELRKTNGVEESLKYDPSLKALAAVANSGKPQDMQNFVEQSKIVQLKMGVRPDQVRVTTDAKISEMAEAINRASTSSDVAARLNHYEQQYGKDFTQAFMEASSEEKKAIPPEYLAVANLANPKDREDLINAIRDPEINIKFDANKKGVTTEYLKQASSEALEPMVKAMGGLPPHFGKGFLAAAQLQMKKMIGEGKSLSDAKKEITAKYFTNNFDSAESSRESIMFPKLPENNKRNIEAFLSAYTPSYNKTDFFAGSPEKFKEFGVYPPKEFLDRAKAKGRTAEQAEGEYYDRVTNSSKWITAPDMKGVMLVTEEEYGKKIPVLDKHEKPIYRSFSDISSRPDKQIIERLKSPLTRMFGL